MAELKPGWKEGFCLYYELELKVLTLQIDSLDVIGNKLTKV